MKKAYLNPNNNPFSKWNQADLVSETYQTAAVNEEKLRAKRVTSSGFLAPTVNTRTVYYYTNKIARKTSE